MKLLTGNYNPLNHRARIDCPHKKAWDNRIKKIASWNLMVKSELKWQQKFYPIWTHMHLSIKKIYLHFPLMKERTSFSFVYPTSKHGYRCQDEFQSAVFLWGILYSIFFISISYAFCRISESWGKRTLSNCLYLKLFLIKIFCITHDKSNNCRYIFTIFFLNTEEKS